MRLKHITSLGSKRKGAFFGYFNEQQFSGDNALFHFIPHINKLPETEAECVKVASINLQTNKISIIGKTPAWNFQQGSKLRYHVKDKTEKICYNSWSKSKGFHSVWISGQEKFDFLPPFYDVSADHFCFSNFKLHTFIRRGYSYQEPVTTDNRFFKFENNDFLAVGNLKEPHSTLFFSVTELAQYLDKKPGNSAKMYVEHMTFSPTGRFIGFLLRFRVDDGGIITNFFTYDLYTKSFCNQVKSGRFSHFCWLDDSTILFYGAIESIASMVRQSVVASIMPKNLKRLLLNNYHKVVPHNSRVSKSITGDGYNIIKLNSNSSVATIHPVLQGLKAEDGHPTFCPKTNLIITDTYPDTSKNKKAKIIATRYLNGEFSEPETLREFGSLAEYDNSPLRADLHPRLSQCGRYLSLDSMKHGYRSVEFYEINF